MALTATDILFYGFALIATISAFLVVFMRNPIYSALFLALSMSVLGALFFVLQAYFIAAAQIIVYAGAVMVLFVMVIMLFDLRHEVDEILKLSPVMLAKVLAAAVLCGFLVGTGWLAVSSESGNPAMNVAPGTTAQDLSKSAGSLPVGTSPSGTTSMAAGAGENSPSGAATENPDEDLTAAEAAKLVEKNEVTAVPGQGTNPSTPEIAASAPESSGESLGSTAALSRVLFSRYVFAFEAVSLLLLVAIVGSVALARSKGGTHHVPL